MNILFLCTANIHRSKTAEDLFTLMYPNHAFMSAGLSEKECKRNGSNLCTEEVIDWADKIYYFEDRHRERFVEYVDKQNLENLNIADEFTYMQSELVGYLVNRVRLHNTFSFRCGETDVLLSNIELFQVDDGWLTHRVTCDIEINGQVFWYKGIAVDRELSEFEHKFRAKLLDWLKERCSKDADGVYEYIDHYLQDLVNDEYLFLNDSNGHKDIEYISFEKRYIRGGG